MCLLYLSSFLPYLDIFTSLCRTTHFHLVSYSFKLESFLKHPLQCKSLAMNSLSFCLSEEVFILFILKRYIHWVENLGWQFFSLNTLKMSLYHFLVCIVSEGNSADTYVSLSLPSTFPLYPWFSAFLLWHALVLVVFVCLFLNSLEYLDLFVFFH